MACMGCAERRKMLVAARAAYKDGDYEEVRRLLRSVFGSAVTDIAHLSTVVINSPDTNEVDRFELPAFKTKKPGSSS